MFLFSDATLLAAVIAARQRGVHVRVMLNPARRDGERESRLAGALGNAGIEVTASNPAFDLTHEKSMVVDDALALVQSLNWETANLTRLRATMGLLRRTSTRSTRSPGALTLTGPDAFRTGDHSHLIWCIGNAPSADGASSSTSEAFAVAAA